VAENWVDLEDDEDVQEVEIMEAMEALELGTEEQDEEEDNGEEVVVEQEEDYLDPVLESEGDYPLSLFNFRQIHLQIAVWL